MHGEARLKAFGWLALLAILVGAVTWQFGQSPRTSTQTTPAPQAETTWPWDAPAKEAHYPGVTHWTNRNNPDGTVLELFKFDFAANPKLQFQIYDQDEDDAVPWDNKSDYQKRSAGEVAHHLNDIQRGKVILALNGLFYDPRGGHVGPVVIAGKMHHNVGRHRWTFGISPQGKFRTLFMPAKDAYEKEFLYAADAAQCLVREGKPLTLEPYPATDQIGFGVTPRAVPDDPTRAGGRPIVDHIRTSRTSLAWSKDSKQLYVLIVIEADTENESARRLRAHESLGSGWNLFDLQRFWMSMKVWGAINSDGGIVTQYAALRGDGHYDFMPARQVAPNQLKTIIPTEPEETGGGTLMSFVILAR